MNWCDQLISFRWRGGGTSVIGILLASLLARGCQHCKGTVAASKAVVWNTSQTERLKKAGQFIGCPEPCLFCTSVARSVTSFYFKRKEKKSNFWLATADNLVLTAVLETDSVSSSTGGCRTPFFGFVFWQRYPPTLLPLSRGRRKNVFTRQTSKACL